MEIEYISDNTFVAKIYFPINAGSNPIKSVEELMDLLDAKQVIRVYKGEMEVASLFGHFDYKNSYLYIKGVDHGISIKNAERISIEFGHTNDDVIIKNIIDSILIIE